MVSPTLSMGCMAHLRVHMGDQFWAMGSCSIHSCIWALTIQMVSLRLQWRTGRSTSAKHCWLMHVCAMDRCCHIVWRMQQQQRHWWLVTDLSCTLLRSGWQLVLQTNLQSWESRCSRGLKSPKFERCQRENGYNWEYLMAIIGNMPNMIESKILAIPKK